MKNYEGRNSELAYLTTTLILFLSLRDNKIIRLYFIGTKVSIVPLVNIINRIFDIW